MIREYPNSQYEAEAKQTIRTCKDHLVQRHLMVGEFYYKRGSYLAAAHRYEKIIKEFPELTTTPEAMFHLAKTYNKLQMEEWTQDWLVTLIKQYPESPYHESAQTLLTSLQEEHPTLLALLPKVPVLAEKKAVALDDPVLSSPPDNPALINAGNLLIRAFRRLTLLL